MIVLLLCGPVKQVGAQDISGDDMRSLDGQVQEIKSEVLSIASELSILEERLLYPSDTQIALFVSIAEDEKFRLDAVQIDINGEQTTHHIYSFKELEALQKGGVQRIYTGNIATGEHQLNVTMIGKLKNGNDFSASDSFVFAKGVKPKALGITLAGPASCYSLFPLYQSLAPHGERSAATCSVGSCKSKAQSVIHASNRFCSPNSPAGLLT